MSWYIVLLMTEIINLTPNGRTKSLNLHHLHCLAFSDLTQDDWFFAQPTWIGESGFGMGRASVPGPSSCCAFRLLHPLPDVCCQSLSGRVLMLACPPSEKIQIATTVRSSWFVCMCIFSYTVLHICVMAWLWEFCELGLPSENPAHEAVILANLAQ